MFGGNDSNSANGQPATDGAPCEFFGAPAARISYRRIGFIGWVRLSERDRIETAQTVRERRSGALRVLRVRCRRSVRGGRERRAVRCRLRCRVRLSELAVLHADSQRTTSPNAADLCRLPPSSWFPDENVTMLVPNPHGPQSRPGVARHRFHVPESWSPTWRRVRIWG